MLVDCQYLSNSKRLIVSYVDNTGDIKLKYYEWEQPTKYVVCSDSDSDRHPVFKSLGINPELFPNSENFYWSEISIPFHLNLTQIDLEYVVEKILDFGKL